MLLERAAGALFYCAALYCSPESQGTQRRKDKRHIILTMKTRPWWITIFRDVHFWVPAIVLFTGLMLLRFVQ
jgi:hypothetical protein